MPLHYQITQELRKRLEVGEWEAGELFPTDKQLMEKYDVSSTTVRRSIYELVKEGWLSRKPGKGTFVREKMVETLQGLTGFFEEIEKRGFKPSAKVTKIGVEKITEETLELIPNLKEFGASEQLYLVEKVQMMNELPVVFVRSYWPVDVGRSFEEYDLAIKGMYDIVQKDLNIILEEAEQEIFAAVADEEEAKLLDMEVGEPILKMIRSTYSRGRLMEVSLNSYRGDRYSYRVQMNKNDIKDKKMFKLDEGNGS